MSLKMAAGRVDEIRRVAGRVLATADEDDVNDAHATSIWRMKIKPINMVKVAIDFAVSFPYPRGNGKASQKMTTTVYAYHKGWDIEIRYVRDRRSFLRPRRSPKFSATGVARPHKKTNLLEWTDIGPHTLTTGDRVFHCGEEAFKQLMLDMKALIDSLGRKCGDYAAAEVAALN